MDAPPDVGEVPAWLSITPPSEVVYVDRTPEWTDRTVHFNRLLRDGWLKQEDAPYQSMWERRHPTADRTLVMVHGFERFDVYGGPYQVEYRVRNADGEEQSLGNASWADWDYRGRLVLAREGRLEASTETDGLETIADFNDQLPDPQPAPEWARQWPERPAKR